MGIDDSGTTMQGRHDPCPVLLYLVTEDWYFNLHRVPLGLAARRAGFRVLVAARDSGEGGRLAALGLEFVPLRWRRGHFNPFRLLSELLEVRRLYRRLRPDLIHHVAMKPSLVGSIAAAGLGDVAIVNNLAGLGAAFSRTGAMAGLAQGALGRAFRVAFSRRHSATIVENADDRDFLVRDAGVPADRVVLIRGVGVDTAAFSPSPEPPGRPVATMVSRMLWAKGVGVLVDAARLLKRDGVDVAVRLVGGADEGNPASVSAAQLRRWHEEGVVEWAGQRSDVAQAWAESHIAVLPSYYREGIPRSLLEAAACGRPIVTTDMPGCREIAVDGVNGILVPPKDPARLAAAIARLASDAALRCRLGAAGRARVEEGFSEARVAEQTVALYRRLHDARREVRGG